MTPKHCGQQPTHIVTAPTKAEHDARVAATGRPYTQPSWDLLGRKPPEHRKADNPQGGTP